MLVIFLVEQLYDRLLKAIRIRLHLDKSEIIYGLCSSYRHRSGVLFLENKECQLGELL